MSELDKALVTSAVTFACLIVFGYISGETVGKSEVIGFAGALAGLIVWYYNEKHSSNLINNDGEFQIENVIGLDEEDLINEEYGYEAED